MVVIKMRIHRFYYVLFFSINLDCKGSSEMGLRLQTSFELPALGSRVALAIVHSLGTSDNSNDRLKSSTIISGIAKNVSLDISLDKFSIHNDLLILISLHNLIISSRFVSISSRTTSALSPLKFQERPYRCANFGPIFTQYSLIKYAVFSLGMSGQLRSQID